MRPIRLPEPPSPTVTAGTSETFEVGAYGIILRNVAIGNGSSAAENQSLGLIRALGLSDKHVLYRLTRPKGGVNKWLHWLPVYLHKFIDYVIRKTYSYSRLMITSRGKTFADMPSEKGSSGVGLASILEADVKQIVNMARQSYEKDGPLLVVARGRDTISISSSIKHSNPSSGLNRFDMVIAPRHDYYPLTPQGQEQVPQFLRWWITPSEPLDKHVVLTLGALHQIDFAALCNAAGAWHEEFAPLPKPLLVVNIAGPTRCCRHGADLAKQLAASLLSVLASCGSIRISFSNRTPQKISKIMIKVFADNPKLRSVIMAFS